MQLTQAGLHEGHQHAVELRLDLQKDDEVSVVTGSSQHQCLPCTEGARDQSNNSLDSFAGVMAERVMAERVMAGVTGTKDLPISSDADSIDPLSAGNVTGALADTVETDEAGTMESDTAFTHDTGRLDESAECDKAFVTIDDRSDTVECVESDEAFTNSTGRTAAERSHECSGASSADANRLLCTDRFTECAEECKPDSSDLHSFVNTAESTGETTDGDDLASAADSSVEYTDTLHSLVSQLKSAVSSVHSGNTFLCLVLFGTFLLHGCTLEHRYRCLRANV